MFSNLIDNPFLAKYIFIIKVPVYIFQFDPYLIATQYKSLPLKTIAAYWVANEH